MEGVQMFTLRLVFETPVLGAQPNRDVVKEHVARRAEIELPEDEEMALPEQLERASTVFHRVDGRPVLFDYQLRGFFAESGRVQNGQLKKAGSAVVIKNLASKTRRWLFVRPRVLFLNTPDGKYAATVSEIKEWNKRSLRAETMMGPRIALASSEQLPEGTFFDAEIHLLPGELDEKVIRGMLDYGAYNGLGQWRNGGWGRFNYALEPIK